MVENILGQARVLRVPVSDQEPAAEEIGQADQQQGKDAAALDGEAYHYGIEGDIDARLAIDLGKLRFRNIGLLLGGHAPGGVQKDAREIFSHTHGD